MEGRPGGSIPVATPITAPLDVTFVHAEGVNSGEKERETAMTQAHIFKSAELCLRAQLAARKIA